MAILFGFGLILKLWNVLDPFVLGFVSDEAIMGLMARHFWDGDFALFYYGQTYGGGIEYLLDAVFYALLPNDLSPLRLSSGLLLLIAEILVYGCARRVFEMPLARLACLAVFMTGSYIVTFELSVSAGVHLNNVVSLAALLAIYLRSDRLLPVPALTGLLIGAGFWVSNYIWVLFLCAASIPLLAGVPVRRYLRLDGLRGAGIFMLALGLGALPRIIYWLHPETWHVASQFGGWTLDTPAATGQQLSLMLTEGLPRFFFGEMEQSLPTAAGVLTLLWVGLQGWALVTGRAGSPRAFALLNALAMLCFVTVLLVITNRYTYDSGWRYIWPLMFMSAFSTGHLVDRWRQSRARGSSHVIPVALLALLFAVGLWTNVAAPRLAAKGADQFAEVIAALERNDCEVGYAPYNYAYTISYLTEEAIILESTGMKRIEDYGRIASQARHRCIILDTGSRPDIREAYLQNYPARLRESIVIHEEQLGPLLMLVERP